MSETFIKHCESMFQALSDRATTQRLEDGKQVKVFAGKYLDAWKATGISQTYYKPVRNALARHGAIQVLQRGSRGTDTVIALFKLPDKWEIDGWNDGGLTKPDAHAKLQEQIEELRERTGGINIVSALAEFEKRVETLEAQVSSLQNQLKRNTTRSK